ncbi:hypothetical protein TNCV_1388671 [Trichonephila clavipes]|nr:hypothetical protein TNCV_1388671 [Trichonephila clavipes]
MSHPNPVEHKSHDVINSNKLSRVMKEVGRRKHMKMAAVKEYSSSPDNPLTVSERCYPEDERTFIVD